LTTLKLTGKYPAILRILQILVLKFHFQMTLGLAGTTHNRYTKTKAKALL